jgi:predicted MPP superfamily phosphohydrolase
MSLRQLAPQEIIGLVTVVSGVGYAYMHAGFLWVCSMAGKKTAGLRWWEKGIMTSSIVLTLCFLYALLVEPYWLEVTHVTIRTPKIAADEGNIRIVLISDLHCDKLARLEPTLPSVIAKEKPDLILFAGDALNQISGIENFRGCMRMLSALAPTYIVEGNHDTRDFPFIKLSENTGTTLLRCKAVDVPIRHSSLHIIGTSVDYERGLPKLLNKLNANDFNIFLYHFPHEIVSISHYPVDLMLAGHTHGGQVCLPFYGAIITHSKTSKKYERGLYKLEDTWLYVNRGIGMDGGPTPRIRFLARPEVTVIDIKPDPAAKGNYRTVPGVVDGFKPSAAKIP